MIPSILIALANRLASLAPPEHSTSFVLLVIAFLFIIAFLLLLVFRSMRWHAANPKAEEAEPGSRSR